MENQFQGDKQINESGVTSNYDPHPLLIDKSLTLPNILSFIITNLSYLKSLIHKMLSYPTI